MCFCHEILGLLATNGIMGMGRVNNSVIVLFGVASADEKLLKDIANFETDVTFHFILILVINF